MPAINRVEPYTALASVYQAAGFASYSAELAPHLLELAFELEWTGRSLLDLACGTGDAACWFAEHSFRATGVDSSAAMLQHGIARATEMNVDAQFVTADLRVYKPDFKYDIALCLGGSLNYIPTLRDLENLFKLVQNALDPGKLFVFDLRTIQGLARQHNVDRVVYDNDENIRIVTRDAFNYETLQLTTQYMILTYPGEGGWQRAEESHQLRGYPVQAIISLLGKSGLKVQRTMTTDLQAAENRRDLDHVLFIARRES